MEADFLTAWTDSSVGYLQYVSVVHLRGDKLEPAVDETRILPFMNSVGREGKQGWRCSFHIREVSINMMAMPDTTRKHLNPTASTGESWTSFSSVKKTQTPPMLAAETLDGTGCVGIRPVNKNSIRTSPWQGKSAGR